MEPKNRMKHVQLLASIAPGATFVTGALGATLLTGALGAALSMGACDAAEPFFRHCPLSQSIITICQENEPDTALTCVVKDHPMCDEQVCAAWEGSDSFCSRLCAADADCPAESTCKAYLDFAVCVPKVLPPAAVAQ